MEPLVQAQTSKEIQELESRIALPMRIKKLMGKFTKTGEQDSYGKIRVDNWSFATFCTKEENTMAQSHIQTRQNYTITC